MRELLERYRRVSSVVSKSIAALESELGGPAPASSVTAARVAALQVESSEIDELMDFQERLSELPGVLKVVLTGTREGTTGFLVELEQEDQQMVVCANCGRTLVEGRPPASHGLCEDCRAKFGRVR